MGYAAGEMSDFREGHVRTFGFMRMPEKDIVMRLADGTVEPREAWEAPDGTVLTFVKGELPMVRQHRDASGRRSRYEQSFDL